MIKRLCILLAALTLLAFPACGTAQNSADTGSSRQETQSIPSGTEHPVSDASGTEPSEESEAIEPSEEESALKITVGNHTLSATFENNSSAAAFRELLSQNPVTIEMEDYGGFEKVGPLGTELTRNDTQITTEPGDVILYQGNQITIYYGTNSWNFTRLAKIDDPSGLREKLGDGTVSVTFSLE